MLLYYQVLLNFLPISADSFEIQLVKNATLTSASYNAVASQMLMLNLMLQRLQ
jgi:hypothetical protein